MFQVWKVSEVHFAFYEGNWCSKCWPVFGGDTRRGGLFISHFHTRSKIGKDIGIYNRNLPSHFITVFFIQNVDPMWGRYQKHWSDLSHLHIRPRVVRIIEIWEIWRQWDCSFPFYKCCDCSKFRPFERKVLEEVNRYCLF